MTSVTVKTVGNIKYKVEVNEETTVEQLQQMITSDAPPEFLKGGIIKKLILKGKTLKEGQKVASLGLGPKDEIVCLAKKLRKRKSKTNSPQPKKEQTQNAESGKPKDASYTINPEDIHKLMGMGFSQHMVIVALRAAFGNPKVACQYLIAGGIPADQAARLQREEEEIRQKLVREGKIPADFTPPQMTQPEAQQPTAGPNGMDAKFEALLQSPDALQEVMCNSQVQKQCMMMLANENPELFKRFNENPDEVGASDEFAKAIFIIMQKSFAKPKPRVIRLTEEDGANIKKLEEQCHVNRKQAATVYVQNGKDFDRTKAFLDDLLRQATEQTEQHQPVAAPAGPASPRAAAAANSPSLRLPTTKDVKIVEPDMDEKEDDNAEVDNTVLTITPDMLFDE